MSVPTEPEIGRDWQYEELALRIEGNGTGRCSVQVTHSPYGSKARHLDFTYKNHQGSDLTLAMEETLRASKTQGSAHSREAAAIGMSPQAIGDSLFRSLFSGSVLETFLLSLGHVQNQPDTGLRIRLQFDPSMHDFAEISSIPWELIYRAETRDHLARNPLTPLVRYLEVPRLTAPALLLSSLRILVVRSRPQGSSLLDLEGETDRLVAAWKQRQGVEIEFLDRATLLDLRLKLMKAPFHVLHFMGHGDFDAETGEGCLVFEDQQRGAASVSGQLLGETLKDCRSLRLAFLNACNTAQLPRRRGQDPFSGVASALLMAGLPAVLTMQFPISDQAALVFSQHFYSALATGRPVDAAAAAGRLAVHLSFPSSWEWATPALFMSVPDGRILAIPAADRPEGELRGTPSEIPRPGQSIRANTVGAAGGITIGGVGQRIEGGIQVSNTRKADDSSE